MSHTRSATRGEQPACMLCGKHGISVVPARSIRSGMAASIAEAHPEQWKDDGWLCHPCLNRERIGYAVARLEDERGELSAVEAEIARKAAQHESVAANANEMLERAASVGERVADAMARVGGSWAFVGGFAACLVAWIAVNAVALGRHRFDPYPFILLNLVLSCLAAVQAPIIMMAQNRVASRDRAQAEQDYRVNLKAELEVASLHEKLDHLLHAQWQRMVDLQQLQIDMLDELATERRRDR